MRNNKLHDSGRANADARSLGRDVQNSGYEPSRHSPDRSGISTQAQEQEISITGLRSGMRIAHDIYDEAGVLLRAAGVVITPSFLQNLRNRGIESVQLRSAPASRTTAAPKRRPSSARPSRAPAPRPTTPPRATTLPDTTQTRPLDDLLAGEVKKRAFLNTVKASERPRLALKDLKNEVMVGIEKHTATTVLLAEICESLQKGHRVPGDKALQMVRDYVKRVTLDFDLLPMVVSLQQPQQPYLFHHSTNVTLLSMATAAQAGMNREQILEIGLGGLLQDTGMLRVPEMLRSAQRPLTPDERLEIEYHPVHTLDYLERIHGLSPATTFIGYQVHERCDGTGYPRRRSGMLIHQYARIVAVADVYAAMISPRPYRDPLSPYEAAKTILVEANRGKFDRTVVRAFLDCVSLFPIGSLVELDSGTRARVIRANPGQHTRPVVELLNDDGTPTGVTLDLSQRTQLKVVRAF